MGLTRSQAKLLGIPWPESRRRPTIAAVLASPLLPEGPPGRWTAVADGWRPHSLNECRNKHWSAEYRAKRATARALLPALLASGVTRAAGKRRLSIHVTREDGKHQDEDNLRKIFHDPCVWLGVLLDDGPKHCESGPYTVGTGPTATTIVIEDIGS